MEREWSLYFAELYKILFEEFGVTNAQFDTTDSAVAFEIVVLPRKVRGGRPFT
jgi:hypothetical protein